MTTTQSLFAADGLDERSLEFLIAALERSNLPGFDYLEFKRAVVTLSGMQMDEATAHKSAFATAATVGVTKEKLLETAAYYRNLLVKEQEHFSTALQGQTTTKVTARQQEIQRLQDQVARHRAEITRLQDEIAGYLAQVEQAETTIKNETEKIDKARAGFERTHTAVLTQLDRDVENIHKHLA